MQDRTNTIERNAGVADQTPGAPITLRAKALDREARLLLNLVGSFVGGPVGRDNVASARRMWNLAATTFGRQIPIASVETRHIRGPGGDIELRIYTPKGTDGLKPGFLWCHGGGFIVGDLDANDAICRSIARAAGAVVVAVRYRLAPEHNLYAGREDFLAALNWVAEHGSSIGIDSTRLAIGGDSAGGNISAAVAQENMRRGGPALKMQVLVYPATFLLGEFPSKSENARGYLLTSDFIDSLEPLIVQGVDLTDPWLSPGCADSLQDLPPALVITAGFDPIRDDGLAYNDRLRAAGVAVESLHYPGQFHGFLNFDSVIAAARDALTRIGAALAHVYAGEQGANRTIEISDRTLSRGLPFPQDIVLDALVGSCLASRSTRQLSSAMARRLSPEFAAVAASMLRPWWMPAAMMRRTMTSYLSATTARQTYVQPPVSA